MVVDDLTRQLPVTLGPLRVEEVGDQVVFSIHIGDRLHTAHLNYDQMLELTPALFSWCIARMIARREKRYWGHTFAEWQSIGYAGDVEGLEEWLDANEGAPWIDWTAKRP